jgi:hypothetical protein
MSRVCTCKWVGGWRWVVGGRLLHAVLLDGCGRDGVQLNQLRSKSLYEWSLRLMVELVLLQPPIWCCTVHAAPLPDHSASDPMPLLLHVPPCCCCCMCLSRSMVLRCALLHWRLLLHSILAALAAAAALGPATWGGGCR